MTVNRRTPGTRITVEPGPSGRDAAELYCATYLYLPTYLSGLVSGQSTRNAAGNSAGLDDIHVLETRNCRILATICCV